MLTGFTWCIPIKLKKATDVARAICNTCTPYLVAARRDSLIMEPNSRMSLQGSIVEAWYGEADPFSSIQATIKWTNRRIPQVSQSMHAKHMRNGLEWDQIMTMATAAYNYFPNMSARNRRLLKYGRDPVNRLSSILNAPRRYMVMIQDSQPRALKTCTKWWHNNCTTQDSATSRKTSTTRS